MTELSDSDLLRQYVSESSEDAFSALVARHVNLVYSAALRKTSNPAAAEEITQAVFVILARKAGRLSGHAALSGWLYQAARLTSANFLRTETRRIHREQEAFMQSLSDQTEPEIWPQIMPLLEDAMGRLGEKDRNALVLRFFEGKTFQEIGTACGASENAAKKRVAYALEKLRKQLSRHGVISTTAAIAVAISANSVHAAPVALAKTSTVIALANGATASASTLTLIKGALKIMAWTKAKAAIVAGVVVLVAAGTTTVIVKEARGQDDTQWDHGEISTRILENAPHIVKIIPAKSLTNDGWASLGDGRTRRIYGIGNTAKDLIQAVYGMNASRIIYQTTLPRGGFDFIANLPSGSDDAVKRLVREKFGVTGKFAMIDTNVLLLKVQNPGAVKLKQSESQYNSSQVSSGQIKIIGDNTDRLANELEINHFRIPVINQTGLTNHFDFNITWDEYGEKVGNQYPNYPNLEGLKRALVEQLGLELVSTNMLVEMLVVEKIN